MVQNCAHRSTPNSSSKTTADEATAPARPAPHRYVAEPSSGLLRVFLLFIIVVAVLRRRLLVHDMSGDEVARNDSKHRGSLRDEVALPITLPPIVVLSSREQAAPSRSATRRTRTGRRRRDPLYARLYRCARYRIQSRTSERVTVAASISVHQGMALRRVVVGVVLEEGVRRVSVGSQDDVWVGEACTLGASALGRSLGHGVGGSGGDGDVERGRVRVGGAVGHCRRC